MQSADINALSSREGFPVPLPGQRNPVGEGSNVSRDSFLKLLTTQLQNQDPLNPQDNGAFLAELAQFQTLEGQLEANDTLGQLLAVQRSQAGLSGLAQAASLVGSNVSWTNPDTGSRITGIVDQVSVENGALLAHVGGQTTPIGLIDSVLRPNASQAASN